jgi:hypothetical protein
MNQVLGTFGLLDFTMLQPVLIWHETYELFISLIFKYFLHRGKLQITETANTESADMGHACTGSCTFCLYAREVKFVGLKRLLFQCFVFFLLIFVICTIGNNDTQLCTRLRHFA